MACNFKINSHRNSDSLHLKLEGNFDGSSALQLIHYLKTHIHKSRKVFIHTNCLKDVCTFGTIVFQKNFDCAVNGSVAYVFTGDKAIQLKPMKKASIPTAS